MEPVTLLNYIDKNAVIWYWFRENVKRTVREDFEGDDLATRMLSTLRPGRDVCVLSAGIYKQMYQDTWTMFRLQNPRVMEWQVIWIDEDRLVDETSMHNLVLDSIAKIRHLIPSDDPLTIVPYLVTDCFKDACAEHALSWKIFGDDLVGGIHKGLMHGRPNPDIEPSKYFIEGVRKARGYSCRDRAEVELAYTLLHTNGVEKMIFKPTFGQGGYGVNVVMCKEDVDSLPIEEIFLSILGEDGSKGEEYGYTEESRLFLVEEFIDVVKDLPSPAVITLTGEYINILDQVLAADCPFVHSGNSVPTMLEPVLKERCLDSTRRLTKAWHHLHGFWGVDYVIERDTMEPILVDLNMGRPNGSHAPSILESTLPANPKRVWKAVKIFCPSKPAEKVYEAIVAADLMYGQRADPTLDEGMLMLAYVGGFKGRAFFCAESRERVDELHKQWLAVYAQIQPEGCHKRYLPQTEEKIAAAGDDQLPMAAVCITASA